MTWWFHSTRLGPLVYRLEFTDGLHCVYASKSRSAIQHGADCLCIGARNNAAFQYRDFVDLQDHGMFGRKYVVFKFGLDGSTTPSGNETQDAIRFKLKRVITTS